jgi:hypothetical protein
LYQDRSGTLHIEPLKFDVTDYKIDSFNSYTKSEISLAKPIKQVNAKVHHYTKGDKGVESTTTEVSVVTGITGETLVIDNPLVVDDNRAYAIATWVGIQLQKRATLDSSWRADVRLDALDIVTNENRYNTKNVRMTEVNFSFNGAFRGTGEGKVI